LVAAMNTVGNQAGLSFDPTYFVVREVALERNRDLVGRTLGEIAQERGSTPADVLVDIALEEDLRTWFGRLNVSHTDQEVVGSLLAHRYVEIGASDAGAHVGTFATYGDTGLLFSDFVRGSGHLSLEAAVKKLTRDQCAIWGLPRRGELSPGFAADVVIFDPDTMGRGPERLANDFPGGVRWVRDSIGVDTVVVNGEVTWTRRDGYAPAARAGRIATNVS
jgi:N-acyl-D-aspartate/D-glutamate deacylase